MRAACALAFRMLAVEGASALDAAEAAVALMEDDPTFDAGRGALSARSAASRPPPDAAAHRCGAQGPS